MAETNNESSEIEDLMRMREGWTQRQRLFSLKAFTIPGYTFYAIYRDAKEDLRKSGVLEKFLDRFDPTLIGFEMTKSAVYGFMVLEVSQYFS